jgi:hypothetical protein
MYQVPLQERIIGNLWSAVSIQAKLYSNSCTRCLYRKELMATCGLRCLSKPNCIVTHVLQFLYPVPFGYQLIYWAYQGRLIHYLSRHHWIATRVLYTVLGHIQAILDSNSHSYIQAKLYTCLTFYNKYCISSFSIYFTFSNGKMENKEEGV